MLAGADEVVLLLIQLRGEQPGDERGAATGGDALEKSSGNGVGDGKSEFHARIHTPYRVWRQWWELEREQVGAAGGLDVAADGDVRAPFGVR